MGHFTVPKRGLCLVSRITASVAFAGDVSIVTALGTGRGFCCVALFIVTERGDRLLRGQGLTAHATFYAVSLARVGTGSGVAGNRCRCGVRAMRDAHRAANVAVGIQLAVIGVRGRACLIPTAHTGAGVVMVVDVIRPSRRVIVPDGGLLHIGGKITVSAGLICFPALFGAGRRLCGVAYRYVTHSGLLRIGGIVTALTVTGDVLVPALLCTGRGATEMRNGIVAEGGNDLLREQNVSAGGAFFTVGQTAFVTGCRIAHQDHGGGVRAMRLAGRAALVTVGIQLAVIDVGSEVCLFLAAIRTNATVVVVFPIVGPLLGKIMPKWL